MDAQMEQYLIGSVQKHEKEIKELKSQIAEILSKLAEKEKTA